MQTKLINGHNSQYDFEHLLHYKWRLHRNMEKNCKKAYNPEESCARDCSGKPTAPHYV
jgi:hypothetical protein